MLLLLPRLYDYKTPGEQCFCFDNTCMIGQCHTVILTVGCIAKTEKLQENASVAL